LEWLLLLLLLRQRGGHGLRRRRRRSGSLYCLSLLPQELGHLGQLAGLQQGRIGLVLLSSFVQILEEVLQLRELLRAVCRPWRWRESVAAVVPFFQLLDTVDLGALAAGLRTRAGPTANDSMGDESGVVLA